MLHLHEKVRKLAPMPQTPSPGRKLAGIAAILLLIVVWAALVAALAPFVGRWPVLVQAPFYLIMGIVWIIPLKPLVRWSQTGYWRLPDGSGGGGQKR
jgi:hypothetical protein